MTRLYLPEINFQPAQRVSVPAATHAHLRARRVRVGDPIVGFSGDGQEWLCTLVEHEKRESVLEIGTSRPGLGFAQPSLTLALAVIAADRMDWAIQKVAELGVAAIWPILATRSQAPGNASAKRPHWQAVAASAAEQCGRARVMEIGMPLKLSEALARGESGFQLWWCEQGNGPPQSARAQAGESHLAFIGPEGGWTQEEIAQFQAIQAYAISLSHATLRSETAAIAAASVFLHPQ